MDVLFLCLYPPLPLVDGGRIRTFHTLQQAALRHNVTLVCFHSSISTAKDLVQLKSICTRVEIVPLPTLDLSLGAKINRLVNLLPAGLDAWHSAIMRETLVTLVGQNDFDLIHIDHILLYQYAKYFSGIPCLLNHHNIENLAQKRLLKVSGRTNLWVYLRKDLEIWRWEQYELASSRNSAVITVVSDQDSQFFSRYLSPEKIVIVPNGVDTDFFRPAEKADHNLSLLFTGSMNYEPNIDAVSWFVNKIFPLLRCQFPGIRFVIAGRNPFPQIVALAQPEAVIVTGHIDDIRDEYHKASVFVVPLRSGGGTRLKILEAMAMGVPVVSTNIGAEGLDVRSEIDLLIANNEKEFVLQINRLLSDISFRQKLSKNARSLVTVKYDWQRIGGQLEKAYKLAIQDLRVKNE